MRTIEQSIQIDAPPEKVWKVLVSPSLIGRWAAAFMEGMHAQCEWKVGGEIVWKEADGKLSTRGRIVECEPGQVLKARFPPHLNRKHKLEAELTETYVLTADGERTCLTIACGPVHLLDFDTLDPMWVEALARIKDLSEKGRVRKPRQRAEDRAAA